MCKEPVELVAMALTSSDATLSFYPTDKSDLSILNAVVSLNVTDHHCGQPLYVMH